MLLTLCFADTNNKARSLVGKITSSRFKSDRIMFQKLIAVVQERCTERDMKGSRPTTKHVRTTNLDGFTPAVEASVLTLNSPIASNGLWIHHLDKHHGPLNASCGNSWLFGSGLAILSQLWVPILCARRLARTGTNQILFLKTSSFTIEDIAKNPDYVKHLRSELKSQFTDFESTGKGLPLLDSFLKESARQHPVESSKPHFLGVFRSKLL